MFFAHLFMPDAEITVWGPPAPETLSERLARYLSPPLTPLHLHELPARTSFRACPKGEWEIGPARIHAAPVAHPGPTHGYRISEGDTSLCYIPDQELAPPPSAQRGRATVAPRLRPGRGRLAPRPRLPVHRRRVPESRRLGALIDSVAVTPRSHRRRRRYGEAPRRRPAPSRCRERGRCGGSVGRGTLGIAGGLSRTPRRASSRRRSGRPSSTGRSRSRPWSRRAPARCRSAVRGRVLRRRGGRAQ
jgi:hypothetical protein